MANWQLNRLNRKAQTRLLGLVGIILLFLLAFVSWLLNPASTKKASLSKKTTHKTVVVDDSLTASAADDAELLQQQDLDTLKKQLQILTQQLATQKKGNTLQDELAAFKIQYQQDKANLQTTLDVLNKAGNLIEPNTVSTPSATQPSFLRQSTRLKIHTVSFRPVKRLVNRWKHYVPANTSVQAVVLGGADADASVNGQSKNNGVMLFKLLENGTLPNGQYSQLSGCRVSANTYGDISSERAFATLYRLSCAYPGKPIIDKEVTGWVFYQGKVGIKGKPLMRDNKVMQWAGFSGALAGLASAAQYAQSAQNVTALGATSLVPSSNMAPYAAYGGATKAADTLSQYYVKRAEQYHPVIQVGGGNIVTIVFKDGFYLDPDDDNHKLANASNHSHLTEKAQAESNPMNFTVPPEVMKQIEQDNQPSLTGENE